MLNEVEMPGLDYDDLWASSKSRYKELFGRIFFTPPPKGLRLIEIDVVVKIRENPDSVVIVRLMLVAKMSDRNLSAIPDDWREKLSCR
jgi:hypothetical protein